MIREIKEDDNFIVVTLNDGTELRFYADYSGYEDCVDLVLVVNDEEKLVVKDVWVGCDDCSQLRNEIRRSK